MSNSTPKKLLIVAGETSGDFYAASLIDVFHKKGDFEIFAIGGTQTSKRPVNLLYNSSNWAAIGLIEAIKQAPHLLLVIFKLKKFMREHKPDLILLVDYPGFNMRLVKMAEKLKIPTLYYFPPGKFADDPQYVKDAAGSITKVAASFLATYEIYKKAGADVEFVGHPLLDYANTALNPEETCKKCGLDISRPVIGLCPGSRKSELDQLLPVMLKAGKIIHNKYPEYQFFVPVIDTDQEEVFGVQKSTLKKMLKDAQIPVVLAEGCFYDLMKISKLLLVSSGTATLEASHIGTPMIICYKVSMFTEIQARLFYKLPQYIGMPNIMLNRMAIPELIQQNFNPEKLANEALEMLESEEKYQNQKNALSEIDSHLGKPGAHSRVVELALDLLNKK